MPYREAKISKPLWDVHIVSTKTSDAQSTCVFRFHHSISDGTSLINLLLASSRKASDPKALPTLHGKKVSGPHIRATIVRSQFIVLWNSLVAVVMFILTGFVSLDDIKMVKNAMDVTVNDVLEAGLYRYLNRRYAPKTRFSEKATQSKTLDTTFVASKSKIDEASASKARDKVIQIVLWVVDSGCSKHMTGDRSLLRNFVEKFMGTVRFGNDNFAAITGYGDYIHGNITICHVYYVEGLGHNLFSVGQFCDGDLEVAFRSNSKTCYVRNLEGG
ncbi:integrase, catalytic region, zinc finger, CCHC-type containing protein [Tanacetum coccineum]